MSDFRLTLDPSHARCTASLNGMWEIAGGDAAAAAMPFTQAVPVPSLVDCAEPPYPWQEYDYHWYRTRFTVMGEGALRSVFLKIHQCMYGTAVWVNGEKAGGSISCYTPQEYKIDGQEGIKNPVGMSGVRLEADVHIVTGQVTSVKNIIQAVQRARSAASTVRVLAGKRRIRSRPSTRTSEVTDAPPVHM